jgi:GH35 family endo-1,4-beta-xylanase
MTKRPASALLTLGVGVALLAMACGGKDETGASEPLLASQEVACPAVGTRVTASLGLSPVEVALLQDACRRIPELRQGEVTIKLVDAAGKPVKDASVNIEQTRHAFLFGGQPNEIPRGVVSASERPKFDELFTAMFNHAYLGGGFQWRAYEPTQGNIRPEIADQYLRWAEQNSLTVRSGDLIYQLLFPDWFRSLGNPDERLRLGLEHVRELVTRFRGRVSIWQVANETEFRPGITEQTEAFTLNIPIEAKYIRIADYLDPAFREAKRADGQAQLVLNEARRNFNNFEVILKELKRRGTPFDVVGLHTHFKVDGRIALDVLNENLSRASQYGRVHMTEVSVPWRPWAPGEQPFRGTDWAGWSEETQGAYIVALYTLFFGNPSVDAITYWAFSERANDVNIQGTALLNESLVPRPAYHVLKSLLKETWWTRLAVKTDGSGRFKARLFFGEHELKVSLAGETQRLALRVSPDTRDVTLTVQTR